MRIFHKRVRLTVSILFLLTLAILTWVAVDQQKKIRQYEFMAAAAQGDISRLRELLSTVDINARFGGDGETALHRAAARGHVEAVNFLLEHGADPNMTDGEGATPLLTATYRSNAQVVKLLLKRGASVNAQETRHGFTPLIQAVARNDKELVRLLLEGGADVSLKTTDGRTALDRATANGSTDIAALLTRRPSAD